MKAVFARPTLVLTAGGGDALPTGRRPAEERAERDALHAWLARRGPAPGPGAHWSHSGGRVACLVGAPGAVGIDLEWLRPRDVVSLARFAYAREEAEAIARLDPAAGAELFYSLWVLKEAAAKLLGLDLLTALATARFEIGAGTIRGELPGCPRWAARIQAPAPLLRLAVLVSRVPGAVRLEDIDCVGWRVGTVHAAHWPEVARTAP